MGSPFVGRATEVAAIRSLLDLARRTRAPAVALVSGEPGTGKSRLLREVMSGLPAQSATIQISGFEPTQPIPFAAVGDLVRRLAAVPEHGPRLEALVFGSDGGPSQAALPIFEAAHRSLRASGPTVLVIDDLQWVDAQSIALLVYLLRAAESGGQALLMVVASRVAPAAATFARGIDAFLPDSRRLTIDLQGLPVEAGIAIARAVDESLTHDAAVAIWQRAAGSPFWIGALARDRGSASVVDVVANRLRSLSADAATLVSALAIVARVASREELTDLLGWQHARIEFAVRELLGQGLASEAGGGLRLVHDLIREAATAVVPASTAARLHARLASTVERSAGEDFGLMAEALEHQAAAGLPTAALAIRLVTSARRRLIGVDLLKQLSAIADALQAGSREQSDLDTGVGRLAADLGEGDLAIRHWSRVASTAAAPADRLGAEMEAARAALHGRRDLAEAADPVGRAREVREHLSRARSLAADPVAEIELDTLDAERLLWVEHDTAAGARAATRAVDRGRQLATIAGGLDGLSVATRSVVLAALGPAIDAALQEERPADVLELSAEALRMAEGLGDEERLFAWMRTAFPYRTLGYTKEAEARYRTAWDLAHRLILPMSMIEAGLGLARSLESLGRIGEAQAVARETADLEARVMPWRRWDTSQAMLHFIGLAAGEPGAVAQLQADAAAADAHFGLAVHEFVATWLARHDGPRRRADIERELEAARAASAIARCPRCARGLDVVSVEILARLGRVPEARAALARWELEHEGQTYPAIGHARRRARATIDLVEGDTEADRSLTELGDALEADGLAIDAMWAWLDLGRVRTTAGDRRGAIAAFSRVAAEAERTGTAALGRLASRSLRELGVRAWRRGPATNGTDLLSLSEREREIAELLAAGSKNREIAESLLISPKTVERHVTNILAKLGVRNRTELAARISTPGTGFAR